MEEQDLGYHLKADLACNQRLSSTAIDRLTSTHAPLALILLPLIYRQELNEK